ncbi:MAG: hypothetical protein ABI690_04835 [Chloroflexota bacterium]
MKPNRRSIGISAGVIIAIIAAGMGWIWGIVAQGVCGAGTWIYYSAARVCGDGFLNHVGLFAAGSFALLIVLLALAAWPRVKPIIRVTALVAFIIYAVWVALFSSSVWNAPYFMAYVYDPSRSGSFDLNCLECRVATPIP